MNLARTDAHSAAHTATPVLIDCDPGIDDTLALVYLAALHHAGEIELLGVTTTAGNVDVDTTARNAAYVLSLADAAAGPRAVPVAPGLPVPLRVPLVTTPETHGPAGLGYAVAPDAAVAAGQQRDWEDLWRCAAAAGAHLIVTGPLTNAASFAARFPEEFARFSAVTVMGGAVNYRGNTTPTAEWNFWVDPHAARDHFVTGGERGLARPSTLCSLEVTEQMIVDPRSLDALVADLGESPLAALLPEVLRFYFEFHQAQGEGYRAQIHDLLTCMVALGTVDYIATDTTIRVEADSELLRGTSVADLRGHWDAPHNARLVRAADIPAAHAELTRAARILAARAAAR